MNESLLTIILFVLCSNDIVSTKRIEISNEIKAICDYYRDKHNIALFQNKFDFVREFTKKSLENTKTELILTELLSMEQFVQFEDDILKIKSLKITNDDLNSYINTINRQYLHTIILSESKTIKKVLSDIEENKYNNSNDIITDFKSEIEKVYIKLVESERNDDLLKSNYLNMSDASAIDSVVDTMSEHFNDPDAFIGTGFPLLDKMLGSGMEQTRLYLFAGDSGCGKSTMVLNILNNWNKNSKSDDIFVYVTLENLIFESLNRLVCINTNNRVDFVVDMIKNNKESYKDIIRKLNCKIHMVYFPSNTLSVMDLNSLLNKIEAETGKRIKGLVVDYLNLLTSGSTKNYEYRIELELITKGLKRIAVTRSIPVVTITQINKASYETELSKKSIKEASGIIDNSDTIIMLQRDPNGAGIQIKIDKNRNGPCATIHGIFCDNFIITEDRDLNTIVNRNNKAMQVEKKETKQSEPININLSRKKVEVVETETDFKIQFDEFVEVEHNIDF